MLFVDGFLVPFLIGIPVVGAIFVALMPGSDRIALRHVGMGATIANAFVALRAAVVVFSRAPSTDAPPDPLQIFGLVFPFHVDGINVLAVFGCALLMPMALRAGAPRVMAETKGYVCGMLVCEALIIAALCAADPLSAFVFASALTYPLMLLLGISGGPTKGSTALRMGTLWAVVDAAALAALVWLDVQARRQGVPMTVPVHFAVIEQLSFMQQVVLCAPLLVAATTRLACLPLTAWVDPFFEDAPVAIAAVVCGAVVPMGAVLVFRFGIAWMPKGGLFWLPALGVLAAMTAVLGGIRGWIERDLRRHCAGVTEMVGALTLAGLCSMQTTGVAAALIFVTASGLALALMLFVIDAIERRYVTRDTGELIGLSEQIPGLWRLFLLSNFAVVGVPLLAGGTAMWIVLATVFQSPVLQMTGAPSSLSIWLAAACTLSATLCAIGAGGHLRRTSAPVVRATVAVPSPLTAGQALRLWIPVFFVIAMGLLTTTILPKMSPHIRQTLNTLAQTIDGGPKDRQFPAFRPKTRAKAKRLKEKAARATATHRDGGRQ